MGSADYKISLDRPDSHQIFQGSIPPLSQIAQTPAHPWLYADTLKRYLKVLLLLLRRKVRVRFFMGNRTRRGAMDQFNMVR